MQFTRRKFPKMFIKTYKKYCKIIMFCFAKTKSTFITILNIFISFGSLSCIENSTFFELGFAYLYDNFFSNYAAFKQPVQGRSKLEALCENNCSFFCPKNINTLFEDNLNLLLTIKVKSLPLKNRVVFKNFIFYFVTMMI